MAIKVKATAMGVYGSRRIRPGEEFEIESEKEFGSWMEKVEGDKPKRGRPKQTSDNAGE